MRDKPGVAALRRGRVSQPGRVYLLTTATRGRVPVFRDFWAARTVVQALVHEHRSGRATTLAYVVMPDHLHWLMQLGLEAPLHAVMGAVKSVSARRIGGVVWQPGFHDHALRREDDVVEVGRYVVANPLRAGLVSSVMDYPHWDAVWLVARDGPACAW